MISKIVMPQGGQDLTTGRIVRWLKKENEPVQSGEVICEVETEKAVFEVPSPQEGFLLKVIAQEGEEIEILSVIGYVGSKDEVIPVDLPKEEQTSAKKTRTVFDSEIGQSQESSTLKPRIIISPKARKLAKDNQIPLESLISDRPDGKITFRNVLRVIEQSGSKTRPITGLPENAKLVHQSRVRKTIAKRLSESWRNAPHIFVTVSVDMTRVVDARISEPQNKISINDYIIFACAKAINKFPEINVSFNDEDTLYYWEDINIGVAVSTDMGLLVTVIVDADRLTIEEIAEKSRDFAEKARAGKQIDSKPSRFTISNLGMFDVDTFTAVINPPEAAILAVSSIKKQPVVGAGDQIVSRDMMNITLSLDHRVGDGVLAAEFINEIKRRLENLEAT